METFEESGANASRTKILYHIHTPSTARPELEVGEVYNTGTQSNRFWGFYEGDYVRCGIPQYDGLYAAQALYDHINSALISEPELNIKLLNFAAVATRELGMMLRELVFEEVRREMFPEKPSRRTSLFVCSGVALPFWMTWFNVDQRSKYIFSLECTGEFHSGSQRFLDSDSMGYNEYRKNAIEYWASEEITGKVNIEILFSGTFRVLARVE